MFPFTSFFFDNGARRVRETDLMHADPVCYSRKTMALLCTALIPGHSRGEGEKRMQAEFVFLRHF